MSDGIEQNGAQVLGLRKLFHGSGALNGNADHAAQGLESGAGKCRSGNAGGSSSARAQVQRGERDSALRIDDRLATRTYHLKIPQWKPCCLGIGAVDLLRTEQIDGGGLGAESITDIGGNRIQ